MDVVFDAAAVKQKLAEQLAKNPDLFIRKPPHFHARKGLFLYDAQEFVYEMILVLTISRSCLGENSQLKTEPLEAEDIAAYTGYTVRMIRLVLEDGLPRGLFHRDTKRRYWVTPETLLTIPTVEEFYAQPEPDPVPVETGPENEAQEEVQRVTVKPGTPFNLHLKRPARSIGIETQHAKSNANFTIRETLKGVVVTLLDGLAARLAGEEKEHGNIFPRYAAAAAETAKSEEQANGNIFPRHNREELREQIDELFAVPAGVGSVTDGCFTAVCKEAGDTPNEFVLAFFTNKRSKTPIRSENVFISWARFARIAYEAKKLAAGQRRAKQRQVVETAPEPTPFEEWLQAHNYTYPKDGAEFQKRTDEFNKAHKVPV